jgi:sterol desaturase/sphingolipid hydroxylase (fatty acid hydroxylase superfamily)
VAPLERKGRAPVERPFGAHWSSDFWLAMISLAFGTPVIAGFAVAHEKWCLTSIYTDIRVHPWAEHGWTGGWAWAYWAASIPAYMLIWDLWFYVLHLVLHTEPVYSWSHANHHAFKPPVAWSGIAIDPVEQFFSGIFPYTLPLFTPILFKGAWTMIPFHIYTVYAINVMLVAWALFLHSSSTWEGNWLMMGPVFHNTHHAGGIRNGNYGAIFKVYDRLFGTLRLHPDGAPVKAPWAEEEDRARAPRPSDKKAARVERELSKLKSG